VKPDKKSKAVANKVYQTFKDWLHIGHLVAIVRFSLRNREQIGILSPFVQDTLIVEPIFWSDEVVEIEDSEFSPADISEQERAVATHYFTTNFYQSDLTFDAVDNQEETIKNIIKARAEGRTIEVVKTKNVKGDNILDLFGDDLAEQTTEEKIKIGMIEK
jgi:non-homologous end joining protein Ku